jgi:transketolase
MAALVLGHQADADQAVTCVPAPLLLLPRYPKEYAEFQSLISLKVPADFSKALPTFKPEDKQMATRQHSQTMLNALAPVLPGLIGGSADLASSNLTLMKMFGDFQKGQVREWAEGPSIQGEGCDLAPHPAG